jgi:alcohol dehydrogenase, propanol-preferring
MVGLLRIFSIAQCQRIGRSRVRPRGNAYDGGMLPASMLTMTADLAGRRLVPGHRPLPPAAGHDVLVRVLACGVCRTDLHIIDGDLPPHRRMVVPGHEIVGHVVARGPQAKRFAIGQRIGIPWLGRACGACAYCGMDRENLCDAPSFTGYDRDGGFAEYTAADERFCFALPNRYDDAHAAPLLCAGLIGFRAWRLSGGATPRRLGLYGFGAAAHIICQIAVARGQEVHAFTRDGDREGQAFARKLGAVWAGGSGEPPPEPLDAALIFAPVGSLVPTALAATRKGGVVVCAGIHMSKIPAFDYDLLWGERVLKSVANLTRADGDAFFGLLAEVPVETHVQTFALADANEAVQALRDGRVSGAAVLVP